MEQVMGHILGGDWVDITAGVTRPEMLEGSGLEFDQIVYTERLTKQEIKSRYPELYEKHFSPSNTPE